MLVVIMQIRRTARTACKTASIYKRNYYRLNLINQLQDPFFLKKKTNTKLPKFGEAENFLYLITTATFRPFIHRVSDKINKITNSFRET